MGTISDDLRKNLITELGLEKLPEKEMSNILLTIGRLIYQGVVIRVMGLLSEKDKDEFDKLLAEKIEDEAAILEFLKSKIPNLDELVNEEVANFKKESTEFIKGLEGSDKRGISAK